MAGGKNTNKESEQVDAATAPEGSYAEDSLKIPQADGRTDGQVRTSSAAEEEQIEKATEEEQEQEEYTMNLEVALPHAPRKTTVLVSPHDQIHEVRQAIIEQAQALQYSCFHLEHKGERINDFSQVSEIEGINGESKLKLVEDPYTEKEARIHVIRVRELVGAAGDRTSSINGVLAGSSLYQKVTGEIGTADPLESVVPIEPFDFTAEPSLATLIPQEQSPAPKPVKSIQLSPWNPPPAYLRQKGHLLYLIVTTQEGEQHQVTSHVGGFFVNKCSNTKFDPSPRAAPKSHSAHSLLTLIEEISPSFAGNFAQLQEHNARQEPMATFQITNALPATPWIIPPTTSPLTHHATDITRTQESFLINGVDNTDTLRDWNEEFQSAKELPKENVQDRVFRERLISKLHADYVDAATKGAVLVARGEVAPLNPTEAPDAQIFVYNNVFFSFGADGVGTFTSEGGDEAARLATGKDVAGVKLVNSLDIDGLHTPGTAVIDYLGRRIVGQSIVPGIFKQREPEENSIDYGAVDGKDVVANDERFVAPFKKLSQAMKVKPHAVWDKDGKRFDLEGSIETKGLMGTDARKYVLDLYRLTPLDVAWMEHKDEEADKKYPHRMTVLRGELVELFARHKVREWVNTQLKAREEAKKAKALTNGHANGEKLAKDDTADKKTEAEEKEEPIDVAGFQFALNPDVCSGQLPQTDEEKEEMAKDEAEVRAAGRYLRESAIPGLLTDLKESDISFPMDGTSLRSLLHKRGINLRYMGKIASLCDDQRLACLREVCIRDMVARSFKHIASRYLKRLPLPLASACVAHLLNCLLGAGLNSKPSAEVDPSMRSIYDEADLAFEQVTPESLKRDIINETARRFRYELPAEWLDNARQMPLLREISLKLGLQLQLKDYHFTAPKTDAAANGDTPTSNGHTNGEAKNKKKKKPARDGSPASVASHTTPHTFSPDDIINIVPIVKDSAPRSTLAEEALEAGKISIAQDQLKLGQELLLESLSLHEQIYGIIHPEVARCYHTLSLSYLQLDDKDAAVELARKAIIVSERTIGVDSQETLLDYLNVGLFLHQQGDSRSALEYVKHALRLWRIIYGPDHPDTITTINNAAVMLQHLKDYHESRRWFEEALRVCETVFGKQSVNSATLLFQLAQALALDKDSKQAVSRMRESYNIFHAQLGAEDKNTKEAESWLEQLTQNAVSIAKHAKNVQERRLRGGIRFVGSGRVATPASASSAAAIAPAAAGPGTATAGREVSGAGGKSAMDSRSIDELIKFIEGTEKGKKSKAKKAHKNPNSRRGGSISSTPVKVGGATAAKA